MTPEENPDKVILKIIGKNYEIITSGKIMELEVNLEKIHIFSDKVKTMFEVDFEESPNNIKHKDESHSGGVSQTPDEAPSIKAKGSTIENIRLLFNTDWGKKPRYISEITKALAVNAVPDKDKAVSTYLGRLVKSSELRRIGEPKNYQYMKKPE